MTPTKFSVRAMAGFRQSGVMRKAASWSEEARLGNATETLVLSLPIGEVSAIRKVHYDFGAVAG
jgi:hypothetical protein